ncbi:hypothetical protein CLAFUW4_09859 [Fulvia fulva]|uniref:Uncharacterized protein n=1 Tax=Passalora fulva TaxID=5499 RepID=A0A9Q8UU83_PASFU|nr:uncharacterized protein CLAFUR5_12380 [Fulvia fulva]KAK4616248.1 hypothetical protein CLAFUR4_09865 [Fulvia fulva]KAK4617340.1 hypothetical protein CLAFUR0_09858 [Fulvia fulva]UJO22628.1 hypothetical protein CLAFUR5_12380 [Fulvia fulva]WPV18765.1 hypothetical protein CLAFUW4_09859 [Fulvia fulva]WPV34297.1 hypothetical protein CLAFUW7_09862 [Fulvia fulva]
MPSKLQTQHPFECFNAGLPLPANATSPRVLATASYDEVQQRGESVLLSKLARFHRHGIAAGLRFTRRQAGDLSQPQGRLLSDITAIPGFDRLRGYTCCNLREGGEWRSAPVSFLKEATVQHGSDAQALDVTHSKEECPVTLEGAAAEPLQEHLYLMLHGWGQPALVLAAIPRAYRLQHSCQSSPDGASSEQSSPAEDVMRCILCEQDFDSVGVAANSTCLFHPGNRHVPKNYESDSDSSESSYDELQHVDGATWTCCGRLSDFSGCAAEIEHILVHRSDLVSLTVKKPWRRLWQ